MEDLLILAISESTTQKYGEQMSDVARELLRAHSMRRID
jgi:hypothetical protein